MDFSLSPPCSPPLARGRARALNLSVYVSLSERALCLITSLCLSLSLSLCLSLCIGCTVKNCFQGCVCVGERERAREREREQKRERESARASARARAREREREKGCCKKKTHRTQKIHRTAHILNVSAGEKKSKFFSRVNYVFIHELRETLLYRARSRLSSLCRKTPSSHPSPA